MRGNRFGRLGLGGIGALLLMVTAAACSPATTGSTRSAAPTTAPAAPATTPPTPRPPVPVGLDLTVTALSATPASPKAGDAVTFTVTVKNTGTAALPSGETLGTGLYLDGATAPSTWTNYNSGLAPGASVTLDTVTSLWPGGTWAATAGAHSVAAIADDQRVLGATSHGRTLEMSVAAAPPSTTSPPTTTRPPTTTPPTTTPPTTTPPTTTPPAPTGSATFFSATSPWNTPLPATAAWHDKPALRAQDWWINYLSYSNPVYIAKPTDPVVTVNATGSWGWPTAALKVHIPAGAGASAGTDQSIVIIDGTIAYDFWIFKQTGTNTATAGAYGQSDIVTGTGWGTMSPWKGAGIRAAGSSGLGGEIYGSELSTGIHHALAIAAPGGFFCADAGAAGFVAPAIYNDGSCEGVRVGIPAGVPMPSGLSLQGKNLWKALQTYGAYNVDTAGGGTVILNADPNSVPNSDLSAAWGDLHTIVQYVRVVN